jgi:hypothetical protein
MDASDDPPVFRPRRVPPRPVPAPDTPVIVVGQRSTGPIPNPEWQPTGVPPAPPLPAPVEEREPPEVSGTNRALLVLAWLVALGAGIYLLAAGLTGGLPWQ